MTFERATSLFNDKDKEKRKKWKATLTLVNCLVIYRRRIKHELVIWIRVHTCRIHTAARLSEIGVHVQAALDILAF